MYLYKYKVEYIFLIFNQAPGASNSLQYSQDPANNLQYSNMAAPKPAVQHGASGLAKPTIPSMPRQSKLSRPGLPTPKY